MVIIHTEIIERSPFLRFLMNTADTIKTMILRPSVPTLLSECFEVEYSHYTI